MGWMLAEGESGALATKLIAVKKCEAIKPLDTVGRRPLDRDLALEPLGYVVLPKGSARTLS